MAETTNSSRKFPTQSPADPTIQFAQPPKAVIFDIGRVIVRLDLARALEPLGARSSESGDSRTGRGPTPEQVWSTILADPRWGDWQEGRMTPWAWYEHLTARLGVALGFEEFCAAWVRALDPVTILSDEFFESLSTRCRLGLLSNTDPIHAAYIERHFSFVRYFPVRIYSNVVGASKPSPAIYQAALRELQVAPVEALYIDDIEEYAEAARQLGMDAIRFEGAAQLDVELGRRGLRKADPSLRSG